MQHVSVCVCVEVIVHSLWLTQRSEFDFPGMVFGTHLGNVVICLTGALNGNEFLGFYISLKMSQFDHVMLDLGLFPTYPLFLA